MEKIFFYELCLTNRSTQNKRENEKMFIFEGVMTKKLILGSHFELGHHFETKLNSTRLITDFSSLYIEINLLKISTKSKICIFRYLHSCELLFFVKKFPKIRSIGEQGVF